MLFSKDADALRQVVALEQVVVDMQSGDDRVATRALDPILPVGGKKFGGIVRRSCENQVGSSEHFGRCRHVARLDGSADGGRTDIFESSEIGRVDAVPFEQVGRAAAVVPEVVPFARKHRFGMQHPFEVVLGEGLAVDAAELGGKVDHDHVVHVGFGQQLEFLGEGAEQSVVALEHLTGMGVEGDDNRFSVWCEVVVSDVVELSDEEPVPAVYAVEGAHGDGCASQRGQGVEAVVYLHGSGFCGKIVVNAKRYTLCYPQINSTKQ